MPGQIVQLSAGRTIAVLLLVVGLLIVVGQHGLASVLASRNPELTLRIAPDHADAAGFVALRSMSNPASPAEVARAARLARQALAHEPLSAVAAGGLGLASDRARQTAAAERQMGFSERLSRRELIVQLWLIENAVGRDDIPGALKHYDIAMRTSRDAPGILFPILTGAIEDPAIVASLADILARRPVWSGQFIQQVAQSGTAFDSISRLYLALRQRGAPVPAAALATVTGRMVQYGEVDRAWALYSAYHPQAAREAIRNGSFDAALADATPFDWVTGVDAEIIAEQRPAFAGQALYFETPMGVGGVAARQLLRLSPGPLRIEAMASDTAGQEERLPYLRLSCVRGGRELGRQDFPVAGPEGAAFMMTATIPRDCAAQWLDVVAQATDSMGGGSGYVDSIRLRR